MQIRAKPIKGNGYSGIKSKAAQSILKLGRLRPSISPDAEKKYLQDDLEQTYQAFVDLVARNRGLNRDTYKEWAEGKVFMADPYALKLGLIDAIGTIFDAEQKMSELIAQRNPTVAYTGCIEFVSL